jgi:hypothetical protein
MAAAITHIVFADKVLKDLPNVSRKEFFIGTSFPDIRYIRVIEREKTHVPNLSIENIKAESNSFRAGFLLHSLLDKLREEYLDKNGLYELIPKTGLTVQALKLFEDQVLRDKVSDWNTVADSMNDILPEETEFGILGENISKWHNILKDYVMQKPSPESRAPLFKELYFTEEQAAKIEETIKEMETNQALITLIENLYRDIL